MKRRALLTTLGTGTLLGLTGCISGAETPTDSTNEVQPTDQEPSATETETPGHSIASQPCPPYEPTHDSAVCSHTVDTTTAPVYLEPNPPQTTLTDGTPTEQVTLTLQNQSSSDLTFNPYSWTIWHKTTTDWQELEPELSGDGHTTVPAENTHSWSFHDAVASIQENPDLEPGSYTAEIGIPNPETDEWISCIALIHLTTSK